MSIRVGKHWAGIWFATRKLISYGFFSGKQFVYGIEPTRVNDRPFFFNDEDWIHHSADWLTGLVRFK